MSAAPSLVSPPKQGRSRLAWARILDAGEQILETEGVENFTISAICERADVSAAAIYARVPGKDALFLAVYERALAQMAAEREQLSALVDNDLGIEEVIRRAVYAVAELFLRRAGFVRSIVLFSNTNEEVSRRGSEWLTQLSREFIALIAERDAWSDRDVSREVDSCYRVVWSTIVMYITYGAGYASERTPTKEEFVQELADVAMRYLTGAREVVVPLGDA